MFIYKCKYVHLFSSIKRVIAKELITEDIPPIKSTETIDKALVWMDEFKVSHLPVVEGNEYLGLVSEDMLFDANNPDGILKDLHLNLNRPFVFEDEHIYSVMKLVSDLNLSICPVLDRDEHYIGLTTLQFLMELITNTSSVSMPGAIIVIEVSERDYSLGHIAQIIENNDAKVLSSYITSAPNSTALEVTIKINRKDIGGIVHALNRFDYVVKESYAETNKYNDDLKNRYDMLMRFLNP